MEYPDGIIGRVLRADDRVSLRGRVEAPAVTA